MCSALAVGFGVQGAATLIQGVSAQQRGDAAMAEDYRSADAAERAAADAVERGQLKEQQVAAHGSAVVGEQRMIQSGTGADVNVGGPKAVQLATAAATEVDKATVAHNAQMQAYGLKVRARGFRQAGVNAKKSGEAAMVGTFLGGMAGIGGKAGRFAADVADGEGDTSYGGGDAPDEAD